MNKIIFWNIRFINTQQDFKRLINLNRRCHYSLIGLMEYLEDTSNMEHYKRSLGYYIALANYSRKIRLFIR